ncbi:MAG: hypothetical protein PHE59_00270 [Patescibacteria group bacterium]|nr:hypothetical protein [Patescibacteria group bacterium]MDD5164441.1 hypothetical protein [Patescibacteria group bacterium]MDD5534360.1 hypothetical protein [Patescibacteria group bacterium]
MLDLEKCREIIGKEAKNLTDQQIESIRDNLYAQAYIIFDFWQKDEIKHNKKGATSLSS